MSSASPTPRPTPRYKPASEKGPAEYVRIPLLPEEAKVASKEGLEAFAQYWYEAANYGYETGVVSLVQVISTPDCETCSNYVKEVEAGFRNDDWMAKSRLDVAETHSDYVLTPEGRYQALVHFRQEKMEFYGPEGLQGEYEPVSSMVQLFEAVWIEDHWAAANIATMQTPGICMIDPTNHSC
ncbi:DUF6318 family protein [Arthrobacter zhaoxinii]|uniref:DUF6318 family protein n=1 Tax=Arthrobacter zhaoxinii TaxID=2964616 RepID=A0ABY5YW39_9MICC|nr:DUF6318 family protein [Arthrobacter zhaoxinii]UWX97860.1 DUF6318 family protein [Arthrobacter zhaoxinii]